MDAVHERKGDMPLNTVWLIALIAVCTSICISSAIRIWVLSRRARARDQFYTGRLAHQVRTLSIFFSNT